jgi:hypothetical protein
MSCKKCGDDIAQTVKYAKIVQNDYDGSWQEPVVITEENELCYNCQEVAELKLTLALKD